MWSISLHRNGRFFWFNRKKNLESKWRGRRREAEVSVTAHTGKNLCLRFLTSDYPSPPSHSHQNAYYKRWIKTSGRVLWMSSLNCALRNPVLLKIICLILTSDVCDLLCTTLPRRNEGCWQEINQMPFFFFCCLWIQPESTHLTPSHPPRWALIYQLS